MTSDTAEHSTPPTCRDGQPGGRLEEGVNVSLPVVR